MMKNNKIVGKSSFPVIKFNDLMELKKPEILPEKLQKVASGAPSSTTAYDIIRERRGSSYQIRSLKRDILQIQEVLNRLQETASSKEEGDFMYEQKEIIEKIDQAKDKISGLETSIALIEERTRKIDNIEQTLSELNNKIPTKVASEDFVGKEINGVKNWVYGSLVAAIIAAIPVVMSFFK